MKKSIEMPIVNVVRFEAKDVITTSTIEAGDPTTTKAPKFAETKQVTVSDPTRFVW